MGKTVRIDPESGERIGKKSQRKLKTAPETFGGPAFVRKGKSKEPTVITEEWAVKRMREHINFELEKLIEREIISVGDKDFFKSKIEDYVRSSVPKYDAKHRSREGKTSTAVHYFTRVVDWIIGNIVRYQNQKKRDAAVVPLTDAPTEEAQKRGEISTETLSDGCRSVRELEFKMDIATMHRMLTPKEGEVLDYRLDGYTFDEIAEKLGCVKSTVIRRYMPHIQDVARRCGFIPQSEIRASFRAENDAK